MLVVTWHERNKPKQHLPIILQLCLSHITTTYNNKLLKCIAHSKLIQQENIVETLVCNRYISVWCLLINILKPGLARGAFKLVGATTMNEYTKHIERDAALERRFQPIVINPPSVKDTIKILGVIVKMLKDIF